MPPAPKRNPARRNRSTTKATLSVIHQVEMPPLPDGIEWHPLTWAWWRDVWASPMAPEYDPSDIHGLYVLASLIDRYWRKPSAIYAAEIRMQRQCFGLSPIDRRRLQWEIERTDEAQDRGRQRRAGRGVKAPASGGKRDPRSVLHAAE